MELTELKEFTPYNISKIWKGTIQHSCCLCQKKIKERKIKVMAVSSETPDLHKQFFFCVKCYVRAMGAFQRPV